jgi:hypothetical protein
MQMQMQGAGVVGSALGPSLQRPCLHFYFKRDEFFKTPETPTTLARTEPHEP